MSLGEADKHRPVQPEVSQLRVPNLIDIDFKQLRAGRLARLQQAMKDHDCAVLLLYNPANVRYATGTDLMGVWTHTTLTRYCIVPQDRPPIMFEYTRAEHVSRKYVADVRPSITWQMMGALSEPLARDWAAQIKDVLRELGAEDAALGIDKIDVFGVQALDAAGVTYRDANPITMDARMVKTPEEVEVCLINGGIGDAMMAAVEDTIRPGVREFDLLAVMSDTLFRHHGEYLFTRVVASGRNTNPWLTEAHDKIIQPGDLVGIDTDANGFEGYVIDASRTFLCGDHPTEGQKDCYRVAYDCVCGMVDLAKPGLTYREFAERAPLLPEKYRDQRYVSMSHPTGLEDESPGIPYPYAEGVRYPPITLQENMILTFECYAGEVGGHYGVKLEDQVVMTKEGCARISTYPFDPKFL